VTSWRFEDAYEMTGAADGVTDYAPSIEEPVPTFSRRIVGLVIYARQIAGLFNMMNWCAHVLF
jgi:hypothetical protein